MPAFSQLSTARFSHGATLVAAATRAQDTARALCAKAEQRIIDSECRATRLALSNDREAWRIYRRQRGMLAEDFISYLT